MIQLQSLTLQALGDCLQQQTFAFSEVQGVCALAEVCPFAPATLCAGLTYAVSGHLPVGGVAQAQIMAQLTLTKEEQTYRITANAQGMVSVCQQVQGEWCAVPCMVEQVLGMPVAEFLAYCLCDYGAWALRVQGQSPMLGQAPVVLQSLLFASGFYTVQEVAEQLQACTAKQADFAQQMETVAACIDHAQKDLQNATYWVMLQEEWVKLQQSQPDIAQKKVHLQWLMREKCRADLSASQQALQDYQDFCDLMEQQAIRATTQRQEAFQELETSRNACLQKEKIVEMREELEKRIANYTYRQECRTALNQEIYKSQAIADQRAQAMEEYVKLTAQSKQALQDYLETYRYELARSVKKEQPCPICGSIHHPRKARKPKPPFDFDKFNEQLKKAYQVELYILTLEGQIQAYNARNAAEDERLKAYTRMGEPSLKSLEANLQTCIRKEKMAEEQIAHTEVRERAYDNACEAVRIAQEKWGVEREAVAAQQQQVAACKTQLAQYDAVEGLAQITAPNPLFATQSMAELQAQVQAYDEKLQALQEKMQACPCDTAPDFPKLQDVLMALQTKQVVLASESAIVSQKAQYLSMVLERLESVQPTAPDTLETGNRLLEGLSPYRLTWQGQGVQVSIDAGRIPWAELPESARQQASMAVALRSPRVSPMVCQPDWDMPTVRPLLEKAGVVAVW